MTCDYLNDIDIDACDDRRESMQKFIEELKGKLAKTTQQSLSSEERSRVIDATMQAEEKRQETLQNELSQLSVLKFRRLNELHEIKQQKRNTDTEIQVQQIN